MFKNIDNIENTLWTEAFRPTTINGYIGNEHIIDKVKIFIKKLVLTLLIYSKLLIILNYNKS